MKITCFEDIDAWKEARKLVKMVYSVINKSKDFKKDFRLVNQIQGAAVIFLRAQLLKFKVSFM
jgi:hypothetical protein